MRRFFNYIKSYFPSPLPIGMTEFHEWADSIRALAGSGLDNVPQEDFKWVLAANIQHAKGDQAYLPKRYFVNVIRKAAASQIAAQIFLDIKAAQEARLKAKQDEAAASVLKSAEATASPVETSDATTLKEI